MSSIQSGSRRQSARLQQKEDHVQSTDVATSNGHHLASSTTNPPKAQTSAAKSRKRKNNYDEEDDGFVFSRVKKKKPRSSINAQLDRPVASVAPPPVLEAKVKDTLHAEGSDRNNKATPVLPQSQDDVRDPLPKRPQKRRMSFSTPAAKVPQPVRRSKRLSTDPQPDPGSPNVRPPQELKLAKKRKATAENHGPLVTQEERPPVDKPPTQKDHSAPDPASSEDITHSATKIALPFADTPVISRNKAMREGKSGKVERRSSMGLRGRRASSLIDSGNSNALPHAEVECQNFYKHIESELTEPRRMRQLLTWCATRAMHPKPQGTSYAEASARSVARVIEEELMKDLANKPELSEWFSREDDPVPAVPLPERPNPKNSSNAEKISELEEQIKRLRSEKAALEVLKRPPSILEPTSFERDSAATIDEEMLSESDANILRSLRLNTDFPATIGTRVNTVITNLGPSIDTFADGIHRINQYRIGADRIASQALSVCAGKLAEREKEGRRKALGLDEDRSPGRDLSKVLRGLSKADR